MNAHERDNALITIFMDRCLPLLQNKGHDYSGDEDALANFRRHGLRGIIVRLGDKYERLNSLVWKSQDAKVAGEKVEDTLVDLINYALLALVVKEEEEPEPPDRVLSAEETVDVVYSRSPLWRVKKREDVNETKT